MRGMERDKKTRIGLNFLEELNKIKRERLKVGTADPLNPKTFSSRRITAAIPRHKLWELIKKDIISDPLKDDLEEKRR